MSSDGAIDVVLERSDSHVSWGFRITGGAGATQPLNVQLVYDDTIADEAGLQIGDRILKIGDVDATSLSSFAAKRLVSQQGDRLCLQIRRRRGSAVFPVGVPTKSSKPDSVVFKAQPARAQDADQELPPPPPTPPSPATAASGAAWSDRIQRTNMPTYQRSLADHNIKLEPWRPPAETDLPPPPKREFRHQVPSLKPQVAQVVNTTSVPSAEAQVSEETINLNRPRSAAYPSVHQPVTDQGGHSEATPEENGDRTKLPSYQRNILLQPGANPKLRSQDSTAKPSTSTARNTYAGESEFTPLPQLMGYTQEPANSSSQVNVSYQPSPNQRNVYAVTQVINPTQVEPANTSQGANTSSHRQSVDELAEKMESFMRSAPNTDLQLNANRNHNYENLTYSPQNNPTNAGSEQSPTPAWTPPPMEPQQSFSIDYSRMAAFPAYQRENTVTTTALPAGEDKNSKTSGSDSVFTRQAEVPNFNSTSQLRWNADHPGVGSQSASSSSQNELSNRSSPYSSLTRKNDLPSGGSPHASNSPNQSRRFSNEDESNHAFIPAYQRDLINRVSPASTLTRRANYSGNSSPSRNSPAQSRKSFSTEEIQQARDQINRQLKSSTLTRHAGNVSIEGWNSPVEAKQFETDEEAQLASLPAYQRDLLTRGSPASTLTRQRPPMLGSAGGSPNSSNQQLQTDSGISSTSTLPSYQRDLMNKLAASSQDPVDPARLTEPVEADWCDPNRRFSVPAYQRDLLAMGSHFDKSASLGRRSGSSSGSPGPEMNDPPQRPILARTYTPSEVIDCDICGKAIIGPFVRILSEYRIHPECVRCCVCGISLRDITRVMVEKQLYCEPHALEFAKPPGEDMVPVIVYPNAK